MNRNWLLIRLAAILFLFFWFSPVAFAQTIPVSELDGYAWSDNIGWISLNCKTGGINAENICPGSPGVGPKSNYKVTINANRTVTGYAWSSNIGWIKFGGLPTFPPPVGGTSAVNANVTGIYPNLTFNGWARACAGTNDPDSSESKDCSVMTLNDNSGGWSGWLALRGIDLTGVMYAALTSDSGFVDNSRVWGDQVIGWVDMSDVLWIHPEASLAMSNCTITVVGESTCQAGVTWNITEAASPNVYNNTTNKSYSPPAAAGTDLMRELQLGSNNIVARDGSFVLATANPTASCGTSLVSNGVECIANVAPPVAPAVTISAARRIARVGDAVNISWTITPSPLSSGTCTLSGPGLSGTDVSNSGNQNSATLRSKSRFSITCDGTYGIVSDFVEIELIPTAQEV